MFENLSERLGGVFDRLTKQGALSEDDVKTALREVRVALLEADVSLPVARDFIKAVQSKATGAVCLKGFQLGLFGPGKGHPASPSVLIGWIESEQGFDAEVHVGRIQRNEKVE